MIHHFYLKAERARMLGVLRNDKWLELFVFQEWLADCARNGFIKSLWFYALRTNKPPTFVTVRSKPVSLKWSGTKVMNGHKSIEEKRITYKINWIHYLCDHESTAYQPSSYDVITYSSYIYWRMLSETVCWYVLMWIWNSLLICVYSFECTILVW